MLRNFKTSRRTIDVDGCRDICLDPVDVVTCATLCLDMSSQSSVTLSGINPSRIEVRNRGYLKAVADSKRELIICNPEYKTC